MDLKELTTFQTIIQEGNFTKAAVKLNYAQSTITNQVQRLEKELGIQLFKRGWDAELTASGQIFAAEIDKLIGHWNHVTEQAKALQREEIGSLHVGGLESMIEHVLPNSLRRFREHKPKVSCHFVNGNTDSLSRAVLQNQLDFAICGEPTDLSSFRFEPLYYENISFIVTNSHPLAEINGIIPFEELLNYPMIVGGNTCLYYLRLSKQYSHYTETPFLYTVSQISAIPGFVQQIPSVGAVLDSTALPPNVVKIHVELKDSSIPVGLLQLRSTEYTSSSKNLLMQYVKEELQRI